MLHASYIAGVFRSRRHAESIIFLHNGCYATLTTAPGRRRHNLENGDAMNLQDFVKSSIVEIIRGIDAAISETSHEGSRAVINPAPSESQHADPNEITFDVAVTVQEDATKGGGASINIFSTKIGVGGDKATSNTAVSRLSFTVPVAWPSVAVGQYVRQSFRGRNSVV